MERQSHATEMPHKDLMRSYESDLTVILIARDESNRHAITQNI
ncbi:hypothetical protein [Crateriforma conspicua]|nr:hypothetical protein [Crateriforma conspicua]